MGPLAIGAVTLLSIGLGTVAVKLYKRRNLRLLREARRKKYAPDLPPLTNLNTTTTIIANEELPTNQNPPVERTRQIEELSEDEFEKWQERDMKRDENFIELRLILQDIIADLPDLGEDIDEAPTEDESIMQLEARAEWIHDNEENLEEHATFVEREMVGSGIIVEESPPENDDLDERLEREGGKSGKVQISLAWDDFNDLDLHLFCPSGERIYFNNKTSECGGELDVDMNVKPVSDSPVENVVWTKDPPKGRYKVGVHFYKHHKNKKTKRKTKYRVRVSIFGKIQEYSGTIKHGNAMQMVTGFTIGSVEDFGKKYQDYQ